jgi:Protein of unknown function (DUF4233)
MSPRVRRQRTAQQDLGSIVLGVELLVVFLGALVLFGLHTLPAAIALGGGLGMAVAIGITIGLLRYRWGFAIGWILQAIIVATGFLVPAFFVVGVIFTGMWTYCMITGSRLDRAKRERTLTDPETENPA